MAIQFADRMDGVEDSFIREILKVTENPEIISFAGGLPNPALFPVEQVAVAAEKVIREQGSCVLQYATTEGYLPLREYIANRYQEKSGLEIDPSEILIVNGSQQGIDLVSKILLNKGDKVLIEEPGYLGAIQAISLYQPQFLSASLLNDGIDLQQVERILKNHSIKLMYSVPNFQNPAGITYSREKRTGLANLLKVYGVHLLEDNPYGDLRFSGENLPPIKSTLKELGILLGSFSKVTVPGIRLGWVCADSEIMRKIKVVKQAADLHSNYMAQRILYQYLVDNDLDEHVSKINQAYKKQKECMVACMEQSFPESVTFTRPEGGMFLWGELPERFSTFELFEKAIKKNVAFVPGRAFHLDGKGDNTFRLNFSNSNEELIKKGIACLADVIKEYLAEK
ncbi:PLP-dependent aminotransferase family protein [bacterium]|nr:PLP-dependent aminotransferase family protein [bacterium]